jgi:hypothetical protein
MVMRLAVLCTVILSALAFASTALADYTYAAYQSWSLNEGYGSSYAYWNTNAFYKDLYGYDTTVTFIDATGYDWHDTVRNISTTTGTTWSGGAETRKAHCLSWSSGFWGYCRVFS